MPHDEDDWELPDPAELSAPDAKGGGDRSSGGDPAAAAQVLKDKRDEIMQGEGVTMVGETIDAVGRSAIMIGVKSAAALRDLPSEIGGVPVVSTVTGEVDALHGGCDGD